MYLQLTCRHVQVPCAHPHGSRHCSFIDGVDLFDNKLFGLSLAETKGAMMGLLMGAVCRIHATSKIPKILGKETNGGYVLEMMFVVLMVVFGSL